MKTMIPYLNRLLLPIFIASLLAGCQSAGQHRQNADRAAYAIIQDAQQTALGKSEPFDIRPPAETLRERLLLSHSLPYSSSASLGTRHLTPIPHWPKDDYLEEAPVADDATAPWFSDSNYRLTLLDALQVAARNSREYQTRKESVFREALQLDLERDEFRDTFSGLLQGLFEENRGTDPTQRGVRGSADAGWSRRLKSGVDLTSSIAFDLVKLLTLDRPESLGVFADATISIPLLRGAGRHIAAEPLTQAERNVIYAIYEFERYKGVFAVQIASEYLGVLRQLNQFQNAEENYRGLIASARRARRLADSGRLPEIQFDQAVQDELRARDRWIQARQSYLQRQDALKLTLGLPPDARLELEPAEMEKLQTAVEEILTGSIGMDQYQNVPPADAAIELRPPGQGVPGPVEMEESKALPLALEHRLDLRVAEGQVYDAQRQVTVAADALRAELTLLGSAQAGGGRSISSADQPDAELRPREGLYSALATLDLPLERSRERNAYRESLIALEKAVRDYQQQEDTVKIDVRNALRDLLEYRESLQIQAQAVELARKRVRSTNLFLQAGRAQIRDLLESQEALLSAQNSLNAAIVNYRIADLAFQRDLGLLEVNEKGLWTEYQAPGGTP